MRLRWRGLVTLLVALTASCEEVTPLYARQTASGRFEYTHEPSGVGWVLAASTDAAPTRPARASASKKPSTDRGTSALAQRLAAFDHHLAEAARVYHLPHAYLRAVAQVESRFKPHVVSHAGAMGMMQLMPFTARGMGVLDPYDPRQNALGGARFLRILANKWSGDLVLTTASYNAGAGAVKKYGGVPPYRETQRYVRRVLSFYKAYAAQEGPP